MQNLTFSSLRSVLITHYKHNGFNLVVLASVDLTKAKSPEEHAALF